jgi:hypothetical protein
MKREYKRDLGDETNIHNWVKKWDYYYHKRKDRIMIIDTIISIILTDNY